MGLDAVVMRLERVTCVEEGSQDIDEVEEGSQDIDEVEDREGDEH